MTHSVVIFGLCGHLIVDKVKEPLEIVKMLRRFCIHNIVVCWNLDTLVIRLMMGLGSIKNIPIKHWPCKKPMVMM